MKIFLSKEDYLNSLIDDLSVIWIVRKHPSLPYRMAGHLAAFTIHKICFSHAEAKNEAEARNKRSYYLFTVQKIDLMKLRKKHD
jgi:hypothetical protein